MSHTTPVFEEGPSENQNKVQKSKIVVHEFCDVICPAVTQQNSFNKTYEIDNNKTVSSAISRSVRFVFHFRNSKAVFTSECKHNANMAYENNANVLCRCVTDARQTAFGFATNIRRIAIVAQLNAICQLSVLQIEFAYDTFRCRHT